MFWFFLMKGRQNFDHHTEVGQDKSVQICLLYLSEYKQLEKTLGKLNGSPSPGSHVLFVNELTGYFAVQLKR